MINYGRSIKGIFKKDDSKLRAKEHVVKSLSNNPMLKLLINHLLFRSGQDITVFDEDKVDPRYGGDSIWLLEQ